MFCQSYQKDERARETGTAPSNGVKESSISRSQQSVLFVRVIGARLRSVENDTDD